MQRGRTHWNRSGQGLVEYVLVIALASVALILVLLAFRDRIGNGMDEADQNLNSASGSYYVPGGGTSGGSGGGSGGAGRGRGGGPGGGRGNGS